MMAIGNNEKDIEPLSWLGCYGKTWNMAPLTPAAYAHPAKVSFGLAERIYQHLLAEGLVKQGSRVLDPFGGIAGFAFHAMLNGLHFTAVELEPKFHQLGNENIALWNERYGRHFSKWGTAQLLLGDSRRLCDVVSGAECVISSPPFSGDKNLMPNNNQGVRSDMVGRGVNPESQTQASPGNLALLRADEGDYTAVVSSPPYGETIQGGEGPGARHDPIFHSGENAYKASSQPAYGDTAGQLGAMAYECEAVVSSPPFESGLPQHDREFTAPHDSTRNLQNGIYGRSENNIGNDSGLTFWAASKIIVEQCYQLLKPGGVSVWVCKDFVRNKKRVEFSNQWQALCEAVGFVPHQRIRAWVIEDKGGQDDIWGVTHRRLIERKSFFRRLAEKKGSPRIDWEDVIILRKPL